MNGEQPITLTITATCGLCRYGVEGYVFEANEDFYPNEDVGPLQASVERQVREHIRDAHPAAK